MFVSPTGVWGGEEGADTKVVNSGGQTKKKSKGNEIHKINTSSKGTSFLAF
jgi:hypothetical protein